MDRVARLRAESRKVVFFKADDDAPYGEVVHLMDLARGAGRRYAGGRHQGLIAGLTDNPPAASALSKGRKSLGRRTSSCRQRGPARDWGRSLGK
jgi:hypothetical protein